MTASGEDGASDIEGDEIVTQQTFAAPTYRNAPRWEERRETNVSVFRGRVSTRVATEYIRRRGGRRELTEKEKSRIRVRRLSATKLREAGFAIIDEPGGVVYPEHCVVVWPADGPVNPLWPPEVQAAFDACSTGVEEGWQEE